MNNRPDYFTRCEYLVALERLTPADLAHQG